MKINSIHICNISSYAGECFFDFALPADKSVILIGGQNGTGKTSLFSALKLVLYGHLTYNYQSANFQYLNKVKELINHDAFTHENVSAYIEVVIEIPNERENNTYSIRREWTFINNRLNETLTIKQDNTILDSDQSIFFENYLYTVLPPNLFEFYFFDGEEIADFFATNSYNTHIKNALLTMCNFDTFDSIRKFCDGYVNKNDLDEEGKQISIAYDTLTARLEEKQCAFATSTARISALSEEIASLHVAAEEAAKAFKNAGGLTELDKEKLLEESRKLESTKGAQTVIIKNFVEDNMPFVLLSNYVEKIQAQIALEERVKDYQLFDERLHTPEIIETVTTLLSSHTNDGDSTLAQNIANAIVSCMKPEIDLDNFSFLHDLSKEQRQKAESVLSTIIGFDSSVILKAIAQKQKATRRTIAINKKMRESMPEVDSQSFASKIQAFVLQRSLLEQEQSTLIHSNEELALEIDTLTKEQSVLYEKVKETAKNKNIYALTQKLNVGLSTMIQELTNAKFKQIEVEILTMLKKILRKDNFIDLIELDANFNISLYKKQLYTIAELENLINNIGQDDLSKRIGVQGTQEILRVFNISSINGLKTHFKKNAGQLSFSNTSPLSLYKKIELSQLSKGEKQIFILALYYAIIKVSEKEIPFIIDTPYARIDTEHREQISKVFFPAVSQQVLILSTDEEIVGPYYDALKPYIAKEYLLQYEESTSKTSVANTYFKTGEQ